MVMSVYRTGERKGAKVMSINVINLISEPVL